MKFRAGKTDAVVAVRVRGETAFEADEELGVSLTSTTAAGVVISDSTATVTIRNDDATPVPGVPTALAADGYDLEVSRAGTTNVLSNVTPPTPLGCGLASVTESCTMRVRAFNGSGAGAWSDPITASTWAPPQAPPNLRMLGDSAVEWDAPASDRPIEIYWVQESVDGGLNWTPGTTTTSLDATTTCSTPPVDEYVVTVNDLTGFPITLTGITANTVDVRMRTSGLVVVSVSASNAAGMGPPAMITVPAG